MFDRYLCKKIGIRNISLNDVIAWVLFRDTVSKFLYIMRMVLVGIAVVVGAEYGIFIMLSLIISLEAIALIIAWLIYIITNQIHVASCPLKKK